MTADGDLVLVTGISGFLGKHVALEAAKRGFRVRGTVRSAAKGAGVLRSLTAHGADAARIEIVEADLLADDGWKDAAAGCRFMLHVASPFPRRVPRERFGLVAPARDGTLRALRAAKDASVERVVLTSSIAAVYYGHGEQHGHVFTEADFSDETHPSLGAYAVSKTLAEKAAWAFARSESVELAVINPSVILGPVLDESFGTSVEIVRAMLRGRMPFLANMELGVVDVRDVAAAHLQAMIVQAAANRRFIASAGSLSLREIANIVADAAPQRRWRIPSIVLPDAAVRLAALALPEAQQALPELGRRKELVATAAKEILGVTFRSPVEAIEATVRSLRDRRQA